MFLIKKKAEQRTIESSTLNNTEKVTYPPLPIFQAKKNYYFFNLICAKYLTIPITDLLMNIYSVTYTSSNTLSTSVLPTRCR